MLKEHSKHGEKINAYLILVGNSETKQSTRKD
jgi:hypothetical protein